MKIKQLSLFLENKPGQLAKTCRVIADVGVNVESMILADTEQFGILRLLIKDYEKAIETFSQVGISPRLSDVLVIAVPNVPGGLASMLDALSNSTINIEYMYGFNSGRLGRSVIVLRLDDPDLGMEYLKRAGVQLLTKEEIFA